MFKLFSIAALVSFLAACSSLSGGGAPDTATLGAPGSPSQSAVGAKTINAQ